MDIEVRRHLYDVPCAGLPIVGEVHVVLVVEQAQADLVSGECPGPELHDAGLLVKRKVRHVYCAGRLKNKKKICQDTPSSSATENKSSNFIPLEASRYIFVTTNLISKYSCSGLKNKMYGKK